MKTVLKYLLIGFGSLLSISCIVYYAQKNEKYHTRISNKNKTDNYKTTLNTMEDFESIGGEPLSHKFSDVLSIKIVLETATKQLYFINSNKYKFHYEFCQKVLDYDSDLTLFNTSNYSENKHQSYLLANINYYRGSQKYAIEFTSSTQYSHLQMQHLMDAIIKNTYIKKDLGIYINSTYLIEMLEKGEFHLPKILASEIYNGQTYQALYPGTCYGILRKLENLDKFNAKVSPNDILIIKGSPTSIPICQGLITTQFQTPLSHISILCHGRKIPAAAQIQIWEAPKFNDLIDKPVKLIISDDGLLITEISNSEMNKHLKPAVISKSVELLFNLNVKRILPIKNISLKNRRSVGNKAASFGELAKMTLKNSTYFNVPEGGFSIPFYYYHQHISHGVIKQEIDKLLNEDVYSKNADSIKIQLKRIRKAIKNQSLNHELYSSVVQIISYNNCGNAYRFRSSSNAEDANNFNGAGLYESKTGILNDKKKGIEKAIKEVWASAWTEKAYYERHYYGIKHKTMMMGILAHRSFPEEVANGVAITKNIYRSDFPGFTVNVQKGEVSVVSPNDSIICEQFICTEADFINPLLNGVNVDYITFSNLSNGKAILNQTQINALYRSLDLIKKHFYNRTYLSIDQTYDDFALDIEFKFDKNGKLYIKQARPY